MAAGHRQIGWTLALVEIGDAAMCQLQCIAQVVGQSVPGLLERIRINCDRIRIKAVKCCRVRADGCIASPPHIVKDVVNALSGLPLLLIDGAARQVVQQGFGLLTIPDAPDRECGRLSRFR